MKDFLIMVITTLAITSCGNKKQPKELPVPKTNAEPVFKQVMDFPVIKDTVSFISNLRQVFQLEIPQSPVQATDEKITSYQKVKLYGSDGYYYLIEYDFKAGAMASYPWKYQLLLSENGNPVKVLNGLRFDLISIFPDQNPFLLILKSTAKGNGGHEIYTVSADTLENVYEGYYDYAVSTYDVNEDMSVFSPNELAVKFTDINKDGFNDIIFTGEKLMLGKYTKDSLWYDVENGASFSIKNPAKKIPVKYIFLYDKQSGHFKEKESYNTN